MTEERTFADPVFKAASREAFLEVYDALDLGKPKMKIKITTYKKGEKGSASYAEFYFDPSTFFGFCESVINRKIGDWLPFEGEKGEGFPAINYGIPSHGPRMRSWHMEKSKSTGNFLISIEEKERRDKWDKDAPTLGKARFAVPPFTLLALAVTSKEYLSRQLLIKQLKGEGIDVTPDDNEYIQSDGSLVLE